MIGTTVGSYRITQRLAEGGMGVVYVATHELMQRQAVVKMLRPDMSVRTDMIKRFFNEARAAASIQHPGIVDVFDMGYTDEGLAYIVMEKLSGETLAARVRRQALVPEKAAQVVRQLASALAAAHSRGIVHRDLKPDNIFLVPDAEVSDGERVKVLDFGIAKLALTQSGSVVTAAGAVFGTPAYMAPEQCADAATVDHRADIYALGCILYECLTGQPPFGHGGLELLAAHLRDEPDAPSTHNGAVPADLDAITLQLLAKDPGHRFQSCTALADALRPYAGTLPGGFPSRERSVPAAYAPTVDPSQGFADTAQAPWDGDADGVVVDTSTQAPPLITTHAASSGQIAIVREEDAWDTPPPGRGRLWVAFGVVALVGVAGAVAITMSRSDKQADKTAGAEQTVADAGATDAARLSPAAVYRHLDEAQHRQGRREWSKTIVGAQRALDVPGIIESDRARAKKILTRANAEMTSNITVISMGRADAAGDVFTVARLFKDVPEDSAYRPAALVIHARARDGWVTPRTKTASKNARRGKGCVTVEGYAREARDYFPEVAKQFDAFAKSCRAQAVASAKRPTPKPTPVVTPPTTPAPTPVVKPPTKPKLDPKLQRRFRAAQLQGKIGVLLRKKRYKKAMRLVRQAWKLAPGEQGIALAGIFAACGMGAKAQAQRWAARVRKPADKKGVANFCLTLHKIKLR